MSFDNWPPERRRTDRSQQSWLDGVEWAAKKLDEFAERAVDKDIAQYALAANLLANKIRCLAQEKIREVSNAD